MSFVESFPHGVIEDILGDEAVFSPSGGASVSITGRFTNQFISQNETELVAPTYECEIESVPGVKHGDHLSVNGNGYKIVGIQPDGQGLVLLILESE